MLRIIKFWASWCGPCKTYAPEFEDAVAKTGVDYEEVNVDDDPLSAQVFGVHSLPTTIILKNDQVVNTITGVTSSLELIKTIQGAQ